MGFSWIFPQKKDPAIGAPPSSGTFDGGCYCGCRGGAAGYAWEADPKWKKSCSAWMVESLQIMGCLPSGKHTNSY